MPIKLLTEGQFVFGHQISTLSLVLIASFLIGCSYFSYRLVQDNLDQRSFLFLIILRFTVLFSLLVILLRPLVSFYHTEPKSSYLGILVDLSKSMQITDMLDNQSRLDFINQILFDKNDGIYQKLRDNFKVRLFGFDSTAYPIGVEPLTVSDGTETDLETAIYQVVREFNHLPLAGLVVLSDGVDQTRRQLPPEHLIKLAYKLQGNQIPVHTIGIGSAKELPDFILQPIVFRSDIKQNQLIKIPITIQKRGNSISTDIQVCLMHEERVLNQQSVMFSSDQKVKKVDIPFLASKPSIGKYRVEIRASDRVKENNSQDLLFKILSDPKREVLFLQSTPCQESSFLKRTLQKDSKIVLTDRYLTVHPLQHPFTFKRTESSISDISPTRERNFPENLIQLSKYDALIIGNLPPTVLTSKQKKMVYQYVSQKGGLLILGGSSSLGDNSDWQPAMIRLLPVELESVQFTPVTNENFSNQYQFTLTDEGRYSPILSLADDDYQNLQHWQQLPKLVGYSRVKRAKANTTVLAIHSSDISEFGPRILLAYHRYRKGRVMIFTPHDSWRWQMMTDKEDTRYHRFWQQTIQWLTVPNSKQIMIDLNPITYVLGQSVHIKVKIRSANYDVVPAIVTAYLTSPDEITVHQVQLSPSLYQPGSYSTTFIPTERGDYKVEVQAELNPNNPKMETVGPEITQFLVSDNGKEFNNSSLNKFALQRLSQLSGGHYFSTSSDYSIQNEYTFAELPDKIPFVRSATTNSRFVELWHSPIVFAFLIILFYLEWIYRKRCGLS